MTTTAKQPKIAVDANSLTNKQYTLISRIAPSGWYRCITFTVMVGKWKDHIAIYHHNPTEGINLYLADRVVSVDTARTAWYALTESGYETWTPPTL